MQYFHRAANLFIIIVVSRHRQPSCEGSSFFQYNIPLVCEYFSFFLWTIVEHFDYYDLSQKHILLSIPTNIPQNIIEGMLLSQSLDEIEKGILPTPSDRNICD